MGKITIVIFILLFSLYLVSFHYKKLNYNFILKLYMLCIKKVNKILVEIVDKYSLYTGTYVLYNIGRFLVEKGDF